MKGRTPPDRTDIITDALEHADRNPQQAPLVLVMEHTKACRMQRTGKAKDCTCSPVARLTDLRSRKEVARWH